MKIKFNSVNKLPLNETTEITTMTTVMKITNITHKFF